MGKCVRRGNQTPSRKYIGGLKEEGASAGKEVLSGDEILPYLRCLCLVEYTLYRLMMLVKWKG